MAEYIERRQAIKLVYDARRSPPIKGVLTDTMSWAIAAVNDIPAADVVPVPEGGIGELSDGYHTFNGLYYQRMVLFAALVKQNKDKAWKSLRHEDGELCFGGGWFIVGIDTPSGSYTYHYEDNFWSMFDCQELPVAKHWDGHTEKDVTRLLSLSDVQPVVHGRWKREKTPFGFGLYAWKCTACGCYISVDVDEYSYCPCCGAKMDGET